MRGYISTLLLAAAALLTALTPQQALTKLADRYAEVPTCQVGFNQVNYWPALDDSLCSVGQMYYNNSQLALVYSQPEGQKLVADSVSVQIYDPAAGQLLKTDANQVNGRLRPHKLISWISTGATLKLNKQQNNYLLQIQPPDSTGIATAKAIITADWLLKDLSYTDLEGNRVSYSFATPKLGVHIPVQTFFMQVPAGTAIIDNREGR